MNRVAEEPFARVLHQQAEEHLGRNGFENQLSCLQLAENAVPGSAILRSKNLSAIGLAPAVHGSDAQAVDLLRAELQLVAQLGRGVGVEGPLHVPLCASRVGGVHLPVDKFGGASFQCPWAKLIGRDDARHGGLYKSPFFGAEECRLIIARRRRGRHFRLLMRLRGRKQLAGAHAKPCTGHCNDRDQGQGLAQKIPARVVWGMLRHCESSSAVGVALISAI
ncbi:hypothetical protein D9M71_466180 [compost metagenome]